MEKLHELIGLIDSDNELSYDMIAPYKKSLYTYYKAYFCCEPVLMITATFNAGAICKIVSSNEYSEALIDYLDANQLTGEERDSEEETINFNSMMLADVIDNGENY